MLSCYLGGQGFLKVALILQQKERDEKSPMKKKSRDFKEGGVRKLLLLFIGEKIPETYDNVRKILEVLNLFDAEMVDTISFASDLKLINIMVGLQGHSCTYACAWCECPTRGEKAYFEPQEEYTLRTLGRIKRFAQKWQDDGSKSAKAKLAFNCVNVPLLKAHPDTTLLELIPPPGKTILNQNNS